MRTLILLISLFLPTSTEASLLDYFGDKAAELLKGYLAKQGIELSWDDFESDKTSKGFLNHDWQFSVANLCFRTHGALKSACFEKVDAGIRYSVKNGLPGIREIGPINLNGGKIVFGKSEVQKPKDRKPGGIIETLPIPEIKLPSIIRDAKFGEIKVLGTTLTVQQKGAADLEGELELMMKPENGRAGPLQANLNLTDRQNETDLKVQLTATSPSGFRDNDASLTLKTNGRGVGLQKLNVNLTIDQKKKEKRSYLTLTILLQQRDWILHASAQGKAAPKEMNLQLNADWNADQMGIAGLQIDKCRVEIVTGKTNLACALQVKGSIKQGNEPKKLPTSIGHLPRLQIEGHVRHPGVVPLPGQSWRGQLEVGIKPIQTDWLALRANNKVSFSGNVAEWQDQLSAVVDLDIAVDVKTWSGLEAKLRNTILAIPAPLNELDGTLRVKANGRLDSSRTRVNLPLELVADLRSETQVLRFTSNGKLTVDHDKLKLKKSHVDLQSTIQEVLLQLPSLEPTSIPPLAKDGRIQSEPNKVIKSEKDVAKDPDGPPFTYDISLQTVESGAIKLKSEYTKEAIPVTANLHLVNGQLPEGSVQVEATALDLFRRKARLDHFTIALRKPTEASVLDGAVVVDYPDYSVHIKITGTVERPRVILDSEPPLPQDDIVAVLIYGEPLDNLDTSNLESAAELSAALSDRALTLASLYLFASTPIQRVSYNPATRKVGVRITIGDGTSLIVGGSDVQQEAGIRRRLGRGWYITTLIQTATEDTSTQGIALLEWLTRF